MRPFTIVSGRPNVRPGKISKNNSGMLNNNTVFGNIHDGTSKFNESNVIESLINIDDIIKQKEFSKDLIIIELEIDRCTVIQEDEDAENKNDSEEKKDDDKKKEINEKKRFIKRVDGLRRNKMPVPAIGMIVLCYTQFENLFNLSFVQAVPILEDLNQNHRFFITW
ncbi:unnamed protein product [Rotaria socialis]